MITITREQQRQILIETANHIISRENTSPHSENLRELARIALASLDANPVAWTDEQELRDVEKHGCGYLFTVNPITSNADPSRVIKLYTAPPLPVVNAEPVAWKAGNRAFVTRVVAEMYASEIMAEIKPLYAAPPALVVPDTLPCPVFLEPGLKFGKGVRTQCMLDALNRRAEYHAELESMTPEQRAEHEAGIAEFKAMLSNGSRGTMINGGKS